MHSYKAKNGLTVILHKKHLHVLSFIMLPSSLFNSNGKIIGNRVIYCG